METDKQDLRALAKKCMPNCKVEKLRGILHQELGAPEMPSAQFAKMEKMVCRPDDVFTIGWPRCGNNWAFFVLDMILRQDATLTTSNSFVESVPDLWSDEQRAKSDASPSPRLFCTHSQPTRFPDLARKKSRIVFIIRNPKDAMISYYKVMIKIQKEHQFVGTWDEFFEVCFGGEYTWGPWFEHILWFEEYMEKNPDVPVYVHHFEEMRENPLECTRRLCAFLGVPDDKAEDIANASNIESVRSAANKQDAVNDRYFKRGENALIQKGQVGNWKSVFTVDQSERFNRMFQEKMAGSKLARLVEKYLV